MDRQLDHTHLKDSNLKRSVQKEYVSGGASPVVSSHHQSAVLVEPVTVLAPSIMSKTAFDKMGPSIAENKLSIKATSEKISVTTTKHGSSITETKCHQEGDKIYCDTTPVADNVLKLRQPIFFESEATVKNNSLEERISEVLRPGNEDEKIVSGYEMARLFDAKQLGMV